MERVTLVTDFPEYDPKLDLIGQLREKLNKSMSEDLKIAMMSGCAIKTDIVNDSNGYKVIIKTANPVSILKSPTGQPISLVELHPTHPLYKKFKQ